MTCQKGRKNMTEEERKGAMANLANSLTHEEIKEEDVIESFLVGNVPRSDKTKKLCLMM